MLLMLPMVVLFFPSINFGLIEAETFPWAIALTIATSFIFFEWIDRAVAIFLAILSVSALITIAEFGSELVFESIRSVFAYINAISGFYVLMRFRVKVGETAIFRIAEYAFCIMLIVGIGQHLSLIGNENNAIIQFFIPRASFSPLGESRGTTILAYEPSVAGLHLVLLGIILRSRVSKNYLLIIFDITVFFYSLFIIKSATSLPYLVIWVFSFYRKNLIFVLAFALTFVFVVVIGYQSELSQSRAIIFLSQLLTAEDLNIDDLMYIVFDNSGFRAPSVVASYFYGATNIVGGGVGNWKQSSLDALNASSIDVSRISYFGGGYYSSVRPTSYLSSLFLDTGLIGVLVFMVLLWGEIKKYNANYSLVNKTAVIACIFSITLLGQIGDPVVWACLALSLAPRSLDISGEEENCSN